MGASVSNNLTLNNTIKIDVQDIFSRLDFLAKMKNADVEESKERQTAKDMRKKETEDFVIDSLKPPKKPINLAEEAKIHR